MAEQRYAILIGNSNYLPEANLSPLRCPAQDVKGFGDLLQSEKHGPYQVERLLDKRHDDALDVIYDTLQKAERDDLVLIYYSGHGKPDFNGELYLATANTSEKRLLRTSVPIREIAGYMEKSKSRKMVLILDCCFSGAAGRVFAKGNAAEQVALSLPHGRGTYVLTACGDVQLAEEKEGDQYSLLTKYIISGISEGGADKNEDGNISMYELTTYVQEQLELAGCTQRPQSKTINQELGDLVIARTGRPSGIVRRNRVRSEIFNVAKQYPRFPKNLMDIALNVVDVTGSAPDLQRRYDTWVDQLDAKRSDPDELLGELINVIVAYQVAEEKAPNKPEEITSIKPDAAKSAQGSDSNRRGQNENSRGNSCQARRGTSRSAPESRGGAQVRGRYR